MFTHRKFCGQYLVWFPGSIADLYAGPSQNPIKGIVAFNGLISARKSQMDLVTLINAYISGICDGQSGLSYPLCKSHYRIIIRISIFKNYIYVINTHLPDKQKLFIGIIGSYF